MNRKAVIAIMVASLAVMLVAIVMLLMSTQSENAAVVSNEGDRHSALASEATTALPSPSPTKTSSFSPTPTPTTTPTPVVFPHPTRVRIPAINVDTRVLPSGLDAAGAVAIPDDITKVGWYQYAATPGEPAGSAVLVAHRDGRVQGHGVFYDLGLLKPGNRIEVQTADGGSLNYTVVSREMLAKSAFGDNAKDLFSITGPPRLTLISCGGYYDRNNGGYQDNIVVTAVPTT